MNADCAFTIGTTHAICEDYARAVGRQKNSYIVLSDGCSGSPDTDFGSRLLVKAAEILLSDDTAIPDYWLPKHAAQLAQTYAQTLGLSTMAIDATLLFAKVCGEQCQISVCGDGAIVKKFRDGCITVKRFSYPSGMPFYPSYLVQPDRLNKYKKFEYDKCIIETDTIIPDGVMETQAKSPTLVQPYVDSVLCSEVEYVALLSDGLESFYRKVSSGTSIVNQNIMYDVALRELVAFKGFQGLFVQRRLSKFKKECQDPKNHKYGLSHSDDLSMAVLYFGDNDE